MASFKVTWEIDVDADSFEDAAREAKVIMGEQALATSQSDTMQPVFTVTDEKGNEREIDGENL